MAFENHESDVRAKFPALQQDKVFLDNAGGSQTLGTVINSVRDYLTNTNVQLGASYAVSRDATAAYTTAYEAGARFINANVDEIVYGPSTTQLFRNLSFALKFKPGDEIVISAIDHEANIAPWIDLAERQDLVIKWWSPKKPAPPSLVVPERFLNKQEPFFSHKTKLVVCTHASNVLGTITDIAKIAASAHEVGALVCVDGVAYAPHRPIDVQALGVDFYAFSWYKVFGPHVSMLYASYGAQRHVKSLGHYFNPQVTLEDKLGLAAGSYELCQTIPHVVEYLGTPDSEMWKRVTKHEEALQTALLSYLTKLPHVTIYGDVTGGADSRVSTVSFTVNGWKAQDVVEAVEAKTNIGFRWGSFYSDRLVREVLKLDQHGVVRVSMVHYNTSKSTTDIYHLYIHRKKKPLLIMR